MTCLTGKRRYPDRTAARTALAVINRRAGERRRENRTYRCNTCNGWHLTSRNNPRP